MSKFEDRFRLIPAVYVLLRRGDEILLLRRFNTGYRDGQYSLPAGHLDGGEPAIKAAVREAAEEVGVRLELTQLTLVHTLHRHSGEPEPHERLDLFFEASNWNGKPTNLEPHKCDELRWAKQNDLPADLVPELSHVMRMLSQGKRYSDLNFS